MAHVDVGLRHEGIGAGPGIVDVVVGDHVAAAGRAHGERLVHVIDDVVLDQAVAGVVADGDAVGAATLDHVRGVVEVRVPNDDPVRAVDLHVRAAHAVPRPGRAVGAGSGNGAVGLDVLHPAIGAVEHVDLVLLPAGDVEVFQPGVLDRVAAGRGRTIGLKDLRAEGELEPEVDGRSDVEGVSAGGNHFDGLSLRARAGRSRAIVRAFEPGAPAIEEIGGVV